MIMSLVTGDSKNSILTKSVVVLALIFLIIGLTSGLNVKTAKSFDVFTLNGSDELNNYLSVGTGGPVSILNTVLNMNNNQIKNLSDPSNPQDAATMSWVNNNDENTQLDDEAATSKVDVGGYDIANVGTPDSSSDAATKGYVDSNTAGGATFKSYDQSNGCGTATQVASWTEYSFAPNEGAGYSRSPGLAQYPADGGYQDTASYNAYSCYASSYSVCATIYSSNYRSGWTELVSWTEWTNTENLGTGYKKSPELANYAGSTYSDYTSYTARIVCK